MSDTRAADSTDQHLTAFMRHLEDERGVSPYTLRNYSQTLNEFVAWHQKAREQMPAWDQLQRDDFRLYLRALGRNKLGRAATQLRFSALRSFYKFLVRRGVVEASPIKSVALPKREKRLPKFLTVAQMLNLLDAPTKLAEEISGKKKPGRPVEPSVPARDLAILETIYSCGFRVSELCGLRVEDIDWAEQAIRVLG